MATAISRVVNIVLGAFAALTLMVLVVKRINDDDLSTCESLVRTGRWSHAISTTSSHLEWHPASCMKPDYRGDNAIIENCFRDIVFVGDSTARQLYIELASRYINTTQEPRAHSNLSLPLTSGQLDFLWDPFLNDTSLFELRDFKRLTHASVEQRYSPRFVVIGAGLHYARYMDKYAYTDVDFESAPFTVAINRLFESRRALRDPEAVPVFLSTPVPRYELLNDDRKSTITPEKVHGLKAEMMNLQQQHGFDVLWAGEGAMDDSAAFLDDGLHYRPFVARMQLEVLTARLCPRAYDQSCCSKAIEIVSGQKVALALAVAVVMAFLVSRFRGSSSTSILQACATVAVVLGYCFVADRTAVFEKVTKLVDEQLFILFCLVAIIIGGCTIARCTSQTQSSWTNQILPRQQTEEWKGWMQVVVLLYHYFGMSHTLWVYRVIRLLVAAYIFLTGYGHGSYFIHTRDFSLRRVMIVLLRINLLACLLPFVMDTHYQFYYFPLLASIWFLVTWATIPAEAITWFSGLRIVSSAMLVGFVYNHQLLENFFGRLFHFGMISIDFKEFRFRVGLDLYAAYLGMAVAMLLTLLPDPRYHFRHLKLAVWVAAAPSLILYLSVSAGQSKTTYNRNHPVLSLLPILGFVAARNATTTLRTHYSRFFAWIGRHSLETFVLQYHIWLAADTKGVLHLGLIDRFWDERSTKGSWRFWVEVVLIIAIFFWICAAVSKASTVIVNTVVGAPAKNNVKESLAMYHSESSEEGFRQKTSWEKLDYEWQLRAKCFALLVSLWAVNVWYSS